VQITLTIPEPLAAELSKEAALLGVPLSNHIIRLLAARTASAVPPEPPLTGANLVEYCGQEGIVGSRPDITDPAEFARELRHRNQNRPQV
jgi:hypothetical protein